MSRFYIFLCCLLSFTTLQAQQISVSGKVSDDVEGLLGVTVKVKERPTVGTITDLDGNYTIQVNPKETLVFTLIGFEGKTVLVNNQTSINVKLLESTINLEDVVISVPYGTAKKSTFTGSAGVISKDVVERSQVSNVSRALQGAVAGVQSFAQSGQPGSEATIRIRGVGSIKADSSPLYVVDGVPYDGDLSSIASNDIESITVLKDAASATLYGSRAANGVIMITTKQGAKDGTPVVSISSKFGFSDRARDDYNQVSTQQNFEMYWEALRNGRIDQGYAEDAAAAYASRNLIGNTGINPYGASNTEPIGLDGKLKSGLNLLWDDNWDDALTRTATYTDLNMNIAGGTAKSKYFISAGYLNNEGYIIESGFKRYTLRVNVTSDVRKWLQVGVNVSGTHSIQNYPKQDDSAITNVIGFARGVPSYYPIYERDLETGGYLNGIKQFDYGSYRATSYKDYNLAGSLPYDKNERKRDAASVRGYIHIEPIKDLTFRTSINVDYNSRFNHTVENPMYGKPATSNGGSVTKGNVRTVGMTINNIANYSLKFGEIHNIRLMAGQEFYKYDTSEFEGTRERITMLGYEEPDAASLLTDFSGYRRDYKLLSFLGNVEYSLKDRYYASASLRSDGSSRFHPDNRWGTFWSVGGSWRIAEEPFMASTRDWLSNLLLRSSYGAQGNDKINDYYVYQALYAMNNNVGEAGLVTDRMATPKLSWETNLNLNIGLDFSLFNNRLSGSVEYFERRSKDLLFNRELAPSVGFKDLNENLGKVKNYGWEASLEGYPIHTKDWKWKVGVNALTYTNKITELPSSEIWNGDKKWIVGGSVYDFYMVEWAGVNPETGNAQWYVYNDNGSRVKTEDYTDASGNNNKRKVGNSLPDISGGFNTSLSFKGVELTALFAYNIGGDIYNRDKLGLMSLGSPGRTWSTDMLDRWTPQNTDTDIPRLTTDPISSWTQTSDRFLVDRSFLRLKTLSLSYNLPKSWIAPLTLKNADIFVQGENLLTFAKQQGLDPEQTFEGITYYRYPAMRTISFGFNVKL